MPEDRIGLLTKMEGHSNKFWETHKNIPKQVIRRLIWKSMAIVSIVSAWRPFLDEPWSVPYSTGRKHDRVSCAIVCDMIINKAQRGTTTT